eukprot:GHVU01187256.1.p2 GENE.GHVU01187256.1~~GHVU01187256.1.p2  ORF type:complete len:195 (-),score=11.66 GHVU01187256.1:719-1303(-)
MVIECIRLHPHHADALSLSGRRPYIFRVREETRDPLTRTLVSAAPHTHECSRRSVVPRSAAARVSARVYHLLLLLLLFSISFYFLLSVRLHNLHLHLHQLFFLEECLPGGELTKLPSGSPTAEHAHLCPVLPRWLGRQRRGERREECRCASEGSPLPRLLPTNRRQQWGGRGGCCERGGVAEGGGVATGQRGRA